MVQSIHRNQVPKKKEKINQLENMHLKKRVEKAEKIDDKW